MSKNGIQVGPAPVALAIAATRQPRTLCSQWSRLQRQGLVDLAVHDQQLHSSRAQQTNGLRYRLACTSVGAAEAARPSS